MTTLSHDVAAVRRFSRFYTRRIGLLSDGILESPYSLTEARVLYEIAQRDSTTATETASELSLDLGYVSRIVRSLERRGLLTKERSKVDRRTVMLRLSPAGRDAFDLLSAASRAQVSSLLSTLTANERGHVVDAMRAIEQTLESESRPEPRVTFRPHGVGDMGWIVQRHGELYHESHAWDPTFEAMVAGIVAKFIEEYDPAAERCWIAEVDGQRAGSVALVRSSETVAQLRLLLVEPSARGLGIGARLVSECVGQARHFGYRSMILFTVAGLDAARSLYEGEGFRLTEEAPGSAWGHDHIAQTWELEL